MKRILLIPVLVVTSCAAPRTTVRSLPPETPLTVAILDFVDHSSSADRHLGSRVADKLSHELFHQDQLIVVERGQLNRKLEEAGIEQGVDISTEEIVAAGTILDADILVMGAIDEYEVGLITEEKQRIALSLELIDASSGELVGVATYRREDHADIGELTDVVVRKMAVSVSGEVAPIERQSERRHERKERAAAADTPEVTTAPEEMRPASPEPPEVPQSKPPKAPQKEQPAKKEPAPEKEADLPDTALPDTAKAPSLLPWQ